MEFEELKGKSQDQLRELVLGWKKELFNLRFQRATGELADSSRFRLLRRAIARAKTRLQQISNNAAQGA